MDMLKKPRMVMSVEGEDRILSLFDTAIQVGIGSLSWSCLGTKDADEEDVFLPIHPRDCTRDLLPIVTDRPDR